MTIDVTNNPPSAADDIYTILHDTTLTQPPSGVLSNDFDMDADPLTAIHDTAPTNGTLTYFNSDGSFEYVPNAGFVGQDSLTYHVNDGLVDSNIATVTIDVYNNPPWAVDDSYSVLAGSILTVNVPGVLANDWDSDGDPRTAVLVVGPSNGTFLNFGSAGDFIYLANAGFSGTDTFQYKANDGFADSNLATVQIHVLDVSLNWVAFEGANHTIASDPDPNTGNSTYYDTQHWLDTNLDGDTNDPLEHAWPVAHTRNWFAVLSARWVLSEPWTGTDPVFVRADGPGTVDLLQTPVTVTGDIVDLTNGVANLFPDQVTDYNPFLLSWEMSVDGGTSWAAAGVSQNRLYLTLNDPTVAPLYHTLVHIGSVNAAGATT